MVFFRQVSKPKLSNRLAEAGNVFMMLIGAVGMVGVIGASTMTVMKGPVKTMSEVTKRTIAENNMIAAGKLALISAATQTDNDCDDDLYIEPVEMGSAISGFTGGGELPASIGVAKEDPWGNKYGYCAWDHGGTVDGVRCTGQNRLQGVDGDTEYSLAIISAGPDGVFNTTCNDYTGPGTLVNKASGADDLILGYTYAEGGTLAGGLWGLQDPDTAEIQKNLSVKDSGDVEQFAFDAGSKVLQIGDGISGTGKFPILNTDNIRQYSGLVGGTINVDSVLNSGYNISTSANISGADLAASGNLAITGNSTIGGTLGVTGATTLAGLTAGTSVLGGTTTDSLGVTNNATVGGTLGVTGATTLSTLNATGAVDFDSTLNVDGALTISSNVIRSGADLIGFLTNTGGSSQGIRVGGIHIGGPYAGSNPIDGEIVTAGAGNHIVLKPGGTTAMTLSSTTQNVGIGTAPTTSKLTIGGVLDMATNKIINLANPTAAADAANKSYVDSAITAGVPGAETDPQVGDVTTAGKWCLSDGDSIECTADAPSAAETDPEVGTLTAGKWCTTNGTTIDCTTNAPGGAGTSAGNLVDADNDTIVQVEGAADEDKIRFGTAGTQRMIIDQNGNVGIGEPNPTSPLFISKTVTTEGVNRGLTLDYNNNVVAPLTADSFTQGIYATVSGSANEGANINYLRGASIIATHDLINSGNDGSDAIGIVSYARHAGSGTLTSSYGGFFQADTVTNGGTITTARGLSGSASAKNSGTITTGAGLYGLSAATGIGSTINNAIGVQAFVTENDDPNTPTGGNGTIITGTALLANCGGADTCYGVRIAAGNADVLPDQDWGIYASGEDKNYFSGKVGIGDTSPDGTLKLDVEGQIGATHYCDPNGANCSTPAAIAAAVAGGDNLGNHTATQALNMATYGITSAGAISSTGQLSLNNNATVNPDIFFNNGGGVAANGSITLYTDANNDQAVGATAFNFRTNAQVSTGGTTIFTIKDTGILSFAGVAGNAPTK